MTQVHQHDHQQGRANTWRLAITLALVLVYMGAEVVGALVADSLALLADAGHMLSDAAALGLTLFAIQFARRPATASRTYGSYRVEILAALANGATLIGIAIYVFVEAAHRFRNPAPVEGGLMLAVASGGLVVNAVGLWVLGGGDRSNLNMRGAWLHVLTDALGSIQAIAAGALIWRFEWYWIDPLASVLIGLLVVFSSWSLIRQSVSVLMEGAPGHVDVDALRTALLGLPHVSGVHDLHVWTITSGFVAMSAHVTCADAHAHERVLAAAQQMLSGRFGIRHSTIQIDRGESCAASLHPVAEPKDHLDPETVRTGGD